MNTPIAHCLVCGAPLYKAASSPRKYCKLHSNQAQKNFHQRNHEKYMAYQREYRKLRKLKKLQEVV